MTREDDDRPRTRPDTAVSIAIVVSSVGGALTAWLPWHSLVGGMIEVRGFERLEGKVFIAALTLAAILAGYHVLAGGPLPARTLVAATATAVGAASVYLFVMGRPESSFHEFMRTVLKGTFCPGILFASVAAITAFVLSLSSLRRRSH